MSSLAILGGPKTITTNDEWIFKWPIVNKAMEDGILSVLREGKMSNIDITKEFERRFAEWHDVKYALAHSSGTASLHAAMYGVGIGRGDEVICPSITYWASCTQALSLGASVIFADIEPDTLCIDPDDIENRITKRTKAIVVVHYASRPADMDRIIPIARKHNLKIIEDVSHAHGALYKGRMVGTFGDAAGFSLMSSKAFAIGEGGIMLTNDRNVYERALMFGHYLRHEEVENPELLQGAGIPWGGYKYRMHQLSSIVGLEQIKKYPSEMAEIDKAMNYFWDLLEGVEGLTPTRPAKSSGCTMGGWYASRGTYDAAAFGGLPVKNFAEAVNAEGSPARPGCNKALHKHPIFNTLDIYGDGKPTQNAFMPEGVDNAQAEVSLPVTEKIQEMVIAVPWFKHFDKNIIEQHAAAFRKVAENYKDLLPLVKQSAGKSEGSYSLSHAK